MSFNKIKAVVKLADEPMLPADIDQIPTEGIGADALKWCQSLAWCLSYVGITSNVYKNSIRFLDPVSEAKMITVKLDAKSTGVTDQILIEHDSTTAPADGKFLRTSWCTPMEAAILVLTTL